MSLVLRISIYSLPQQSTLLLSSTVCIIFKPTVTAHHGWLSGCVCEHLLRSELRALDAGFTLGSHILDWNAGKACDVTSCNPGAQNTSKLVYKSIRCPQNNTVARCILPATNFTAVVFN